VARMESDTLPQEPRWSYTWSAGSRWCAMAILCRRHFDNNRTRGLLDLPESIFDGGYGVRHDESGWLLTPATAVAAKVKTKSTFFHLREEFPVERVVSLGQMASSRARTCWKGRAA
jgi:hypothetical protein